MARSREEVAQDYGRRLAKKVEEYIINLDQSRFIKRLGYPLDVGQMMVGAASYLSYRADKWTTLSSDDDPFDSSRN